jgi:Uma2 family endonuclease
MSLSTYSGSLEFTIPQDMPILRLSVAQYHEMIAAGILDDSQPVELLEGLLVRKMNKNPPHRIATGKTRRVLEQVIPSGWYVDTQEPITTGDSEPEPDVSVVRGRTEDYAQRHPGPAELALVAEVAYESLLRDRLDKKQVYAKARIAVYWIINLIDSQVEVYTNPTGPAQAPDYLDWQVFASGDSIPLIIDGREVARVAVADLLP